MSFGLCVSAFMEMSSVFTLHNIHFKTWHNSIKWSNKIFKSGEQLSMLHSQTCEATMQEMDPIKVNLMITAVARWWGSHDNDNIQALKPLH
jgi:hypothetical protein